MSENELYKYDFIQTYIIEEFFDLIDRQYMLWSEYENWMNN